jgi:DNA-nicking Smr family endonuclease
MSGSRKKAGDAEARFNNPFAKQLRLIGKKIRKNRRAAFDAHVRNSAAEAHANAQADSQPPNDDDLFASAIAGAQPLETGGRRVAVRAGEESRRPRVQKETHIDPTSDEHFDLRFSDQYIRGRAEGVSKETVDKLSRGEFAVRSHVDLHGMALDHAKEVVDEFIAQRRKNGERCVLVITGKGRNSPGQVGVLRQGIPEWLARGPSARCVLAFVTARPCDGGEGALYVLLSRHVSRKARIEVDSGSGA